MRGEFNILFKIKPTLKLRLQGWEKNCYEKEN